MDINNPKKQQSGLGIAGMILGITAVLLSCILVGGVLGAIGIVLSIVGLTQKDKSSGTAIAGTVLNSVAIVIAAIFFIVSLGSTNQKENDPEIQQTENSPQKETTVQESNTKESSSEEVPSKEDESNKFHVGDTLETKKIKLSYLSCGDYSDDNMFVAAGDGCKLIYFEFECENVSNSDVSIGYIYFDCYADGYDASRSLSTADNAMSSIVTLSPGRKTKGIVVFEVPEDAQSIEVEYETDYWRQDKAIFVYE